MNILGISCFYHDSAAALVQDGRIMAAAPEERFTGVKHDPAFSLNAARFCLNNAGLNIEDINHVVFYDKPFLKFDRIISGYLQTAPFSYAAFRKAIPLWLKEKIWLPQIIKKELGFTGEVLFLEHHLSHAAGVYYSSPFDRAAVLTVDGVGEWATASIGKAIGNKIELHKVMNYPHSLGLLYSAFTYFLGFRVNSAEYKVMGLASYGNPVFADLIEKEIVKIFDDGSLHLNLKYFNYHRGRTMTNARFEKLFGRLRRNPESALTDSDRDIAASIQAITEKILFKMAVHCRRVTGESRLCLSGGVALNCAAAGKLLKSGVFEDIYIQPSATDSGGAIGAALYFDYALSGREKTGGQDYLNLGPVFRPNDIESFLRENKIPFRQLTNTEIAPALAAQLAQGKIVGLFQGPMEFGPRALGFRSLLADPRDPAMKEKINRAVKFREPFRPFAPVVLGEKASGYFDCDRPSPYMLFNFEVLPEAREKIPAVTHIDGTARIQTVSRNQNPRLYDILTEFEKITGLPVLLNTSFNLRGYPIVRTPKEAFAAFVSSGIDILLLENCLIEKTDLDVKAFASFRLTAKGD